MKKLYFSVALFAFLSVHGLMLAKVEPVPIYFFILVWWSYIFLMDSIIFWKRGSSLITRLQGKFFFLIFSSASFWSFFEILNLRIVNWCYCGPDLPLGISILFTLLAFGSVLPAILETHEFLQLIRLGQRLEFLDWEKSARLLRWQWWGRPHYLWRMVGITMIAFSLIWPDYFFWMIWLALIFILDPQVEKETGESILSELRKGRVRTFYRLLLTGLICGILWEAWNYWAELKWIYKVPFVGNWKIFEMPLLGYFGFPFFAVECYLFYRWLFSLRLGWERRN